jgi:hypothetical protein
MSGIESINFRSTEDMVASLYDLPIDELQAIPKRLRKGLGHTIEANLIDGAASTRRRLFFDFIHIICICLLPGVFISHISPTWLQGVAIAVWMVIIWKLFVGLHERFDRRSSHLSKSTMVLMNML